MAPRVGFEPTTIALTERRSTTELPRNIFAQKEQFDYSITCMERKELIRTIYLYLFSLVGLVIVVIGLVNLVDLGLKAFVFTNADQPISYPAYPAQIVPPDSKSDTMTTAGAEKYDAEQVAAQEKQRQSDRERTASNAIAMILIGAPLFPVSYTHLTLPTNREV